jgi:hypothetical protein
VPSPLMMCAHVAAMTSASGRQRRGHPAAPHAREADRRDRRGRSLSTGGSTSASGSGYQNYEFERLGADIANNKVMFTRCWT